MKNYLTEWKKFKSKTRESAGNVGVGGSVTQDSQKAPVSIAELDANFSHTLSHGGSVEAGVASVPYAAGGSVSGNATASVDSIFEENTDLTEEELEEACGQHEGIEEGGKSCMIEIEVDEVEEEKQCNECRDCTMCSLLTEAKYKGKKVPLGKPMRGDVKKFKVYVRDPKTGNVKKVNFGDKKMRIKKSNPKRRKSFRARHRCANPGPRTKARYWSCRKW